MRIKNVSPLWRKQFPHLCVSGFVYFSWENFWNTLSFEGYETWNQPCKCSAKIGNSCGWAFCWLFVAGCSTDIVLDFEVNNKMSGVVIGLISVNQTAVVPTVKKFRNSGGNTWGIYVHCFLNIEKLYKDQNLSFFPPQIIKSDPDVHFFGSSQQKQKQMFHSQAPNRITSNK